MSRLAPNSRWKIGVVAAVLLAATFSAAPAFAKGKPAGKGGSPAPSHVYGGEATAVFTSVAGLEIELAHAGPIPSTGGMDEESVLSADVSTVSATVLHAVVVGEGDSTNADASAADVAVSVESISIAGSVLTSQASVTCAAGMAAASGDSSIADLSIMVAGVPVPVAVSGEPNQTVSLLGLGTLVINEQITDANGGSAAITVNAIHLTLDSLAEVIVSSSTASMTCDPGGPVGAADDWFTGGGTIFGTPTGDRASFGVAGGLRNGSYWGHLNYVDHAGTHFRATSITAYEVLDDTSRRIEGVGKVGKQRVTYVAEVSDNGEPGTADTFLLELSNGYSSSDVLAGGNIQLHPTH